jgi:drug/metabolite transporter (DMT)-like permease
LLASRSSNHEIVRTSDFQGEVMIVPVQTGSTPKGYGHKVKLVLAFASIYLLWGSTYLAIHYAVMTVPPLSTAGIRDMLAGIILLAWAWARGFRPKREHWLGGMLTGSLFFLLGHSALNWAEQYVTSGAAALLIATEPMFILVFSCLLRRQRITWLSAVGLGVGVAGVALLTGAEFSITGTSVLGLAAVLLSALAWSAGVVVSPMLRLPSDALARTAIPLICGGWMLLAAAALTGEFHRTHWSAVTRGSLLGLGYLVVFGSVVAFTAYTWLLQHCPPTLVATHAYVNPLVAVLLGWWLASESLTARMIWASATILGSIVLVRQGERREVISQEGASKMPSASDRKLTFLRSLRVPAYPDASGSRNTR